MGNNVLDSAKLPGNTSRVGGSKGPFPFDEGKHVLVIARYFAYGDESYDDPRSGEIVVGGYVGSVNQWKGVRKEWRQALPEGIPEFHAADFFSHPRKGNFKGMADEDACFLLDRLVHILERRTHLRPISCGMNIADFYSFTRGERRYLSGAHVAKSGRINGSGAPDRPPYQLAFMTFLDMASAAVKDGSVINFVLDRNDKDAAQAFKVFNEFKDRHRTYQPEKFGTIQFGDSASEIGLQAADLYTYLFRRMMRKRKQWRGRERRAFERLVTTRQRGHWDGRWSKEIMSGALDKLSETQRRALAES